MAFAGTRRPAADTSIQLSLAAQPHLLTEAPVGIEPFELGSPIQDDVDFATQRRIYIPFFIIRNRWP